ncbi:MAG TPA: hypothetical protein VN033_09365 [Vulgatibacter sp.]|nr:hypothetical protein [Vulgatibacter sp.]
MSRLLAVAVVVLSLLAACAAEKKPGSTGGGGTGGSGGGTGEAPRIESFASSADRVRAGRPVTLSWIVEGTAPIHLTLDGVALAADASSIELAVHETHTFRLVAENDFGSDSAEVEVVAKPEVEGIFPAGAVVDPGEAQRFYATRAGAGTWSASCGAIERVELGSAVWRAPAEEGSCEIELDYEDGVAAVGATVQTATPTVTRIEGLSGPSDTPGAFAQAADGTFVARGWNLLTEHDLNVGTWTSPLDLAGFLAQWVLSGPDKTIHALGIFVETPPRAAWLRKRPGARWEELPGPTLSGEGTPTSWMFTHATVAPDGRLCASVHMGDRHQIQCTEDDAWSVLLDERPGGVTSLAFDGAEDLHFLSYAGAVFSFIDGGIAGVGEPIEGGLSLAFVDGALHVAGEGVFRWDAEEEEWVDLSEGLPESPCPGGTLTGRCKVASLVELDGDLFAISAGELYGKAPGEPFERVGDLPPTWNDSHGILLVAGSRLWLQTTEGLTSAAPWSDEWALHGLSGTEFGRHPSAIAFRPDGTIAFAASSFESDNDPVYVLEPGAETWKELAPGPLLTYHHVRSLAYRPDGALAIGTIRVRGGEEASGRIYFSAPGNTSYEPLSQDGLPPWTTPGDEDGTALTALAWTEDGTLLAAIDDEGVFYLQPGEETWEPLGNDVRARDLLVLGERILVATDGGVVELSVEGTWEPVAQARFPFPWQAATQHGLAVDEEGVLWSATSHGVFRLAPGETWSPVGHGECSVLASGVFVGGGRVWCSTGERIAELSGGRWIGVPALGTGEGRFPAKAVEAGPDGALYLDLNVTLRGSLVRTLP